MRAVIVRTPGGLDALEIAEVPAPRPGPGDLLVRNFATALNRADILQRRGLHPPPPGESEILGLEFAGEVAEAGSEVQGFRRGDRVFGLVGGGACAEFVVVDARSALRIPDRFSFDAAAAVPEAFFTASECLHEIGGLAAGQTVLVHAGASGIGSAAIQLARFAKASVITTVGSEVKAERCIALGAARAIRHREEDFADVVRSWTGGRGVDLIVDLIGAKYWERNVASIVTGGKWVLIGLLGGSKANVDLWELIRKRIRLAATSLRGRSREEKASMAERFARTVLPILETGAVRPVIDTVLPFEEVRAAHERMEANLNIGKIILRL